MYGILHFKILFQREAYNDVLTSLQCGMLPSLQCYSLFGLKNIIMVITFSAGHSIQLYS